MSYGLKTATIFFDKDGNIVRIVTKANMPGNLSDVRTIEAIGKNVFWKNDFECWKQIFQQIFQRTTAHGHEV